ncbi:MAG: cyclic di-GMP phosphodiesterase [Actinomycetota bacterium]|nr:cyclic di-GMP phosphodiesterase [Actinomycetota bacterium]
MNGLQGDRAQGRRADRHDVANCDSGASVLLVDDEEAILRVLLRILKGAGYQDLVTASSNQDARRLLATKKIDLVVTDMQMPGGSGLGLLSHIHETMPGTATLMVTGEDDAKLADKALSLGAFGYIIKPFRPNEVVIGVSNALRRRTLELVNQDHRDHLEEIVKARTGDLWQTIVKLELSEKVVRATRAETIERLAVAGEYHDEETGFHVERMSRYCQTLAQASGHGHLHETIREASSLHDVGKIGVPDSILLKPGPLLPEECAVMQEHAAIGYGILKDSESPLLNLAAEIALTHHEKVDGTGYPNGLIGSAIPIAGRIAAIADVFDALTSNRVYRRAFPLVKAVEMMKRDAGAHFDTDLLSVFWKVLPEVLAIEKEFSSRELTS